MYHSFRANTRLLRKVIDGVRVGFDPLTVSQRVCELELFLNLQIAHELCRQVVLRHSLGENSSDGCVTSNKSDGVNSNKSLPLHNDGRF